MYPNRPVSHLVSNGLSFACVFHPSKVFPYGTGICPELQGETQKLLPPPLLSEIFTFTNGNVTMDADVRFAAAPSPAARRSKRSSVDGGSLGKVRC